jgi:bacillopeptidase F (M6 metalloprotease family)
MKLEEILFILLVAALLTGCGSMEEKGSNSSSQNSEQTSGEAEAESDFSTQIEMIANDEKIIEMLKDSGEIPDNASTTEIQKALEDYLKKKAINAEVDQKSSEKYIEDLKKQIQKDLQKENE